MLGPHTFKCYLEVLNETYTVLGPFISQLSDIHWKFFLPTSDFSSSDFLDINLNNGEGNGTPLQYFCLENPMDGEAW